MKKIIESNNMQVCNECDRHCPVDALRCERGVRTVGYLTDGTDDLFGDRHERGRHVEHRDRHERGGRSGQHGRVHEFDISAEGSEGLCARLRQCGHFLFHNGKDYSSQRKVLTLISEHSGEITQRELTGELGIHRASVSELLGKLEKKGFITRRQDDRDRRCVRISLTDKGTLSLQENIHAQSEQDLDKMFASLSEAEKNSLYAILGKLINAWGEAQSHGKGGKIW